MKKDYLRYILSVLTNDLETFATSEQVEKFKKNIVVSGGRVVLKRSIKLCQQCFPAGTMDWKFGNFYDGT